MKRWTVILGTMIVAIVVGAALLLIGKGPEPTIANEFCLESRFDFKPGGTALSSTPALQRNASGMTWWYVNGRTWRYEVSYDDGSFFISTLSDGTNKVYRSPEPQVTTESYPSSPDDDVVRPISGIIEVGPLGPRSAREYEAFIATRGFAITSSRDTTFLGRRAREYSLADSRSPDSVHTSTIDDSTGFLLSSYIEANREGTGSSGGVAVNGRFMLRQEVTYFELNGRTPKSVFSERNFERQLTRCR